MARWTVALGFLAALVGCPGTLEDPQRFLDYVATGDGGVCPDVPSVVFVPICATSGCHTPTDKAQGLDLQSADVASRLVGVASTEGRGLLIDPATPAQSDLYTKLTSHPPYGTRMPFGKAPLSSAAMQCVLAWITAEAATGDAEATGDAGAADAASDDATVEDSGALDSGPADSAVPPVHDAGGADATSHDSGIRDAGSHG